jgi:rubrerythrin
MAGSPGAGWSAIGADYALMRPINQLESARSGRPWLPSAPDTPRRNWMNSDTALDVLKKAILLECRGRAFYRKVADQAEKQAVREFFQMMAEEEERHVEVLGEQFKSVNASGGFCALAEKDAATHGSFSDQVITRDLVQALSAASFEAAAISAAMTMEKNAIRLYDERAKTTGDPEEKALYEWLARWEESHLDFLARVEREITETVWFDNNFWPF